MAADLISFSMPRRRTLEGSTVVVSARFRNRSSAADVTPTNIKYRIDCLTTKVVLQDWAAVTASTSTNITVTSTQNLIQNNTNKFERKQLTVASDYGLSTEYRDTIVWETKRKT